MKQQRERNQINTKEYKARLLEEEIKQQRKRNQLKHQETRRNKTMLVKENDFDNIMHDDLIEIEK